MWPPGAGSEARLEIYRRTVRETFAAALRLAYPLLHHCMGPEEFRRLAWTYQRACPSPAGNLFWAGARLGNFLEEHLGGTEEAYLIDVARLEWVLQQSLVAPDRKNPRHWDGIAAVPAHALGALRLRLHPSVGLLATTHGVFGLWSALQRGQPLPPVARQNEYLLARRWAEGLEVHLLSALDWRWLAGVEQGLPLGAVLDLVPEAGAEALGALLVRWVKAGVVQDFRQASAPEKDGEDSEDGQEVV